ncbi:MAG: rod shape-determining protein MreC [Candidatus Komeilibacteria bacterium CG10_big_fil_rev_8_21_14_0_10_41_13]|uniref:Cell shape-determining protein MreC n=1 Tax=Candidatus Komeilibacteria bacterium CG10_big_fil_rev_8_21_14_0_10_41_13 TaxID=1974476 RepID=A0A2M6WDE2_9BACT|nr:MAG: rod shape-determining protein MreC [Candidatus Komeilibacteria bacterium CG10_big_fil_rev_8_21_14_0_10_41_13]
MRVFKKNQLTAVIAVIILLIFFHFIGLLPILKNSLVNLFTPVQKVFFNWGSALAGLGDYNQLAEENESLRREISRLGVDYVKLSALTEENSYLKAELGFLESESFDYVLASVAGLEPFNDEVVIINQGLEAGLAEGQAVTLHQGVIVGKIIRVEASRAFVQLLTDRGSQLAVSLENNSETSGLLKGNVANNLLIDLIPQDKEIAEGDLVITSGLEEKIPRGLLVGRVGQVDQVVGQIFKQAKINPLVSYHNFNLVTVIKGRN